MWFDYKGFDAKGVPLKGTIEGADEADVVNHLRRKGIFGVQLRPSLKAGSSSMQIMQTQMAPKNNILTSPRKEIVTMRFNYENLRDMLRSMFLDLGVTEKVLRNLIIDLKSDEVEKQKKVIEFIEDMGFEKEALELSKAFLFRTDFHNTQNPEDDSNS